MTKAIRSGALAALAVLLLAGCAVVRPQPRFDVPAGALPADPDSFQVAAKVAAVMAENDITLPQVAAFLNVYGFDVVNRALFHRWRWTPPTTGSPVAYYVADFRAATGDSAMTIYLPQTAGPYWIRVRGVDFQGRTGPWSESNQSAPGAILPGVAD